MGVQIQGDTGNVIATKGTYSGNVTIGGTLTYEDVTNIDSVGLVTARNGIEIGARPGVAASISVDGNAIFSGITTATTLRAPTGIVTSLEATTVNVGIDTGVYGEDLVVTGNTRVTGITTFGDSDNPASMLNIDATSGLPTISIPDSIIHSGDTDTKIRFSAADTISIETGGITRATVTGNTIDFPDAGTLRFGASNDLQIYHGSGGASNIIHSNTSQPLIINASGAGAIRLDTNSTERLRINSDGRVLIGDDTPENTIGLNARVQTFGTDASTSGVAIRRGSNDAQAAFLVMSKSRNASVGSRTILQNGDEVGNIFFAADDGTDLVSNTAAIKSQINGTPGANDTPGNLSFWTTADGANTAVQRMTIDSNGHITKPYQFHIEVDRDSDQTGYNASANFGTPMIFNRVIRTIGTQNSALDTSTGKITVPVAGVYFLEATAYATTASLQQGWFTEGTSRMNYSDHAYDSKTNRIQTVGMHYLAANTEVGYKPYGSSETNVTIGDSVYHTWMRVTLIG